MAVRLLLDENLSERLVVTLAPRFAGSLHVRQLGLRGPPPKVVWLNVGNVSTTIITQVVRQNAAAIEAFAEHPELGFLALGVGPLNGRGHR